MFKAATKNVSFHFRQLKRNVTPKFFTHFALFFSFLGVVSLNYGEDLKKDSSEQILFY